MASNCKKLDDPALFAFRPRRGISAPGMATQFVPKKQGKIAKGTARVPFFRYPEAPRLASIGSLKGNGKGYNLCELLFPFREGTRYVGPETCLVPIGTKCDFLEPTPRISANLQLPPYFGA